MQFMVMDDGTLKGIKLVLEERGINTICMDADDKSRRLFKWKKHYLENRGHIIPKFHCD